jgi:hypothetical protein
MKCRMAFGVWLHKRHMIAEDDAASDDDTNKANL